MGYVVVNNSMDGYISVNEASRRLGRSIEQVRRYLREGKLRGQRIGGQWFVDETEVAAWRRKAGAGSGRVSEAVAMYNPAQRANNPINKANLRAIALLDKWLSQNPQEQQNTWQTVKNGLAKNRLSSRKLFQ